MYKKVIRPILFLFKPETIHYIVVFLLRVVHYIPGARALLGACYRVKHPALERNVFGMKFPNPVGLAAGFDKNAEVYREIISLGFGFVEVGTITPKPQPGNPKPRLFRLPEDNALINRMGFNNHGVDAAVRHLRFKNKRPDALILGGNLGKNTATPNEDAPADYLRLFRSLYEYVNYFVINVSCPNIANLRELHEKSKLTEILNPLIEFRRGQNHFCPILLKVSPDLSNDQLDDIVDLLMEEGGGIDGVVAINTTISREGLQTDEKEVREIGHGGLSGAPLHERALEVIRYIHEKTEGRFPIIGAGGILSEEDALAMLDAGADLIQVYTGFIYNGPSFVKRICKRIIERENARSKAEKNAPENQSTELPGAANPSLT